MLVIMEFSFFILSVPIVSNTDLTSSYDVFLFVAPARLVQIVEKSETTEMREEIAPAFYNDKFLILCGIALDIIYKAHVEIGRAHV